MILGPFGDIILRSLVFHKAPNMWLWVGAFVAARPPTILVGRTTQVEQGSLKVNPESWNIDLG